MAPSMMESIVMRKCDVPLKKARAITKEAREKIKLKRACLWSKEWEEECLAIYRDEVERIKAVKAEQKAQQEYRRSHGRSDFHSSVKPLTSTCGTETSICGFGTLPENGHDALHGSRRKSSNTETSRVSERRPSVAHQRTHRSESRASTVRARHTDDLIGMSVGGEVVVVVETFEEEPQRHRSKSKPRKEKEGPLSASSSSKKKKMRGDSRDPDSPERKHHHRTRSLAKSAQCDHRPAVRRTKSNPESYSKSSHTHRKAEKLVNKREKSGTRSKSRKSHGESFEDKAAQQRRHHRSPSRHRQQSELQRESVEDDGDVCKPSRRSTMAVTSEYSDEPSKREHLARRMSQQQEGQHQRSRSKLKPRATSKEEFEAKFHMEDLDQPDRSSNPERRRMSYIGTSVQNSPEEKNSRRDKGQAQEEQLPTKQLESSPEQPLKLKPLLPRRMSSSDDDDDDISLDFEGLAFMAESPTKKSPKRMSGSSNAFTRYLENLSESSVGDFNKSKASLGSCKSSESGKKRMVPFVRTKSSNSPQSGASVSRRNETVRAAPSPSKIIRKLKTPNTAAASEPAKSSLRNSRYKQTSKNSLKLPDHSCHTYADDFDHPEHDGKTLTSRTVSTVSTSSSDWTDFF